MIIMKKEEGNEDENDQIDDKDNGGNQNYDDAKGM
jgi:hypothetical protein